MNSTAPASTHGTSTYTPHPAAGYTGTACEARLDRKCSNRLTGEEPLDLVLNLTGPRSHVDTAGKDLNWLNSGWTASRCAGGWQAAGSRHAGVRVGVLT
jgi:hypothetical protein